MIWTCQKQNSGGETPLKKAQKNHGRQPIGIYFFLFFTFYKYLFPKSKVYLFLFEKVIGKIGISYFTYRKMQPSDFLADCFWKFGFTNLSIADTQEYPLGVYLEMNHCISILLKLNAII